jgi:tetratricopeptide (TPR) repeat protein
MGAMMKRILAGRYRIERLLGRGGMGEVDLATDLKSREQVAVKLLHEELAMRSADRLRFKREFLAAKELDHPNIVRVFDVGEADGRPFYTMEYLSGGNLREVLLVSDTEELGPAGEAELISEDRLRRVIVIFAQILDALQYLHRRQIIHRDLKPENIKVLDDDQVKLLDFGLCRLPDVFTLSLEGAKFAGTPMYLAPEIIRAARPDARMDLYAVGVMLFEAFTGRAPIEEKDLLSVLREKTRVETFVPRDVNPAIPEELDRLIRRLLQRSPGSRPPTAAVVMRYLAEFATSRGLRDSRYLLRRSGRIVGEDTANELFEPRMVGRREVLGHLRDLIAQLPRRGSAVVVVTGEVGSGRTRFLSEVQRHLLSQDYMVLLLSGQAARGARTPELYPLIKGLADADLFRELPALHRSLLITEHPWLSRFEESVDGLPVAPEDFRIRTTLYRTAVRKLMLLRLRSQPLAVLVDDTHLVAPETLETLRSLVQPLVQAIPHHPVLLVLTCAPQLAPEEEGWRVAWRRIEGVEHCLCLELEPLSMADMGLLVQSALGDYSFNPVVAAEFAERCRGNPKHAYELLSIALRSGSIVRRGEDWYLRQGRLLREATQADVSQSLDNLDLPQALRESARERLALLPPPAREMLDYAAIQGERFRLDWLSAQMSVSCDELLRRIDHAIRAGLVQESGAAGYDFEFRQHYVREAIYEQMDTDARVERHAACSMIAERMPFAEGSTADVIAAQAQAGHLWERAYRFWRLATEAALAQLRLRPAVKWAAKAKALREAHELPCGDPPIEALRARSLGLLNEHRAAIEDYTAAITHSENPLTRRDLRVALAWQLLEVADYERADRLLQEALEGLDPAENSGLCARALLGRAEALRRTRDTEEARALAAQALELCDGGETATTAIRARVMLLLLDHKDSRRSLPSVAIEDLVEDARRLGAPQVEMLTRHIDAMSAYRNGDIRRAADLFDRVAREAVSYSMRTRAVEALCNAAGCYRSLGRFDDALARLDQAMEVARAMENPANLRLVYLQKASLALSRDDFSSVLKTTEEALTLEAPSFQEQSRQLLMLRGIALLHRGHLARALEEMRRACGVGVGEAGEDCEDAWSLLWLAEAHRRCGHSQECDLLLRRVEPLQVGRDHPQIVLLHRIFRSRWFLEQNDPQAALDLLDELIPTVEEQGSPQDLGELMREKARACAQLGRIGEAQELLQRCFTIFSNDDLTFQINETYKVLLQIRDQQSPD